MLGARGEVVPTRGTLPPARLKATSLEDLKAGLWHSLSSGWRLGVRGSPSRVCTIIEQCFLWKATQCCEYVGTVQSPRAHGVFPWNWPRYLKDLWKKDVALDFLGTQARLGVFRLFRNWRCFKAWARSVSRARFRRRRAQLARRLLLADEPVARALRSRAQRAQQTGSDLRFSLRCL